MLDVESDYLLESDSCLLSDSFVDVRLAGIV